jgi:hypothetical protein
MDYDTLSDPDKKKVINSVEQEYLAYLFLNNSVRILLRGYLYAVTQHLLTRKELYIFKFPERFLVISCTDISLSWLNSLY